MTQTLYAPIKKDNLETKIKFIDKINPVKKLKRTILNLGKQYDLAYSEGREDEFVKNYYYKNCNKYAFLTKILYRIKVFGKNNAKNIKGKPMIFIANHQNHLDPFMMMSAIYSKKKDFPYTRFLSKKENSINKYQGILINCLGGLFLNDERRMDNYCKNKINETLDNGDVIALFPEGTRHDDGLVHEFKSGAARYCLERGIPYLPISIHAKNLPKLGGFGKKIRVNIGSPVYPKPEVVEKYNKGTLEEKKNAAKIYAKYMEETIRSLKKNEIPKKCAWDV